MLKQSKLQEQMINDANLILESIDWIEKEIEDKLKLFEKVLFKNNIKEASKIEKELIVLLRRLDLEKIEMDNYMSKYTKIIKNEKEKILHNSKPRQ